MAATVLKKIMLTTKVIDDLKVSNFASVIFSVF